MMQWLILRCRCLSLFLSRLPIPARGLMFVVMYIPRECAWLTLQTSRSFI